MARGAPAGQSRYVAPLFELDPADAEYLIVARRLKSGSYAYYCREVLLRPFVIRTYQLGQTTAGDPHARTPWNAAMWAASLFSVDDECRDRLA
jgi:hypothetical protein